MIKKIRQKHKSGCTVASLAMLLDISYNKALSSLHPKRKRYQQVAGDLWKISATLRRLKKQYILHNNLPTLLIGDISSKIDIRSMKKPALLCVYTVDLHNANHAVVWDPETQKVLDPGRKRNMPVDYYQKRLTFAFELV